MELTTIKKVEATNARITIIINPENADTSMQLSYTCNECAGYGCNRHRSNNSECNGGTVSHILEDGDVDTIFSKKQLVVVREAVQNLHNQLFKKDIKNI